VVGFLSLFLGVCWSRTAGGQTWFTFAGFVWLLDSDAHLHSHHHTKTKTNQSRDQKMMRLAGRRVSAACQQLPPRRVITLGKRKFHAALGASSRPLVSVSWVVADGISATTRQQPLKREEEDNQQTILACSSSNQIVNLQPNFWRQVWESIVAWWEWIQDAWVVTSRGLEIVMRFSPLVALGPCAVLSSRMGITQVADVAWEYTYAALHGLGPAFIKLAQWIATRRDFFPPHICDRFSKLHDAGFPHDWNHTHRVLIDAFGHDYDKKLQLQHVIGSGSAAQVYRGLLLSDDSHEQRPVAIKVLHPRFVNLVERDIQFLEAVANLLHSLPIPLVQMLNLPRVAKNVATILEQSSDLCIEAKNLERFIKHFGKDSAVYFPKPQEGWVSRSVLVEELVEHAQPIAEFLQDSSEGGWEARIQIAGPLLRAFLKMVFLDNFVHGDLHPGNVLIMEDANPSSGKKTSNTRRIVFLDAGIATSLSQDDQQNLLDLFRAVLLNDGATAGRLMVERAKYERCSQVEGGVEAFASGVNDIVSEFHDRRKRGLTLGAVRIGSLLGQVLDLCRIHGVEIDPSMASVVLSTLVLEGLGRSLHPDLNLIDFAIPFVLGRGKV